MRHAALLLAVLAGACGAAPTPTRDDLAQALKGYGAVGPTDLTHIACRSFPEEPAEFVCRWRQREGRQWHGWQSYLAMSGDGWQLIDTPTRRP